MPSAVLPQTEEQFVDSVIELAQRCGWKATHFRPAKTERGWRTPLQGDKGWPDITVARDGVVHFWEAKRSPKEVPTVEQSEWLRHLPNGRVVSPEDWDWVETVLTARGRQLVKCPQCSTAVLPEIDELWCGEHGAIPLEVT